MCWTKGSLGKDGEELLFHFIQILLCILSPWKCSVPSLKDTLRHCTTSVHFALVQSVLKCALKTWEGWGVRESVSSVVTVLSLWLLTLCIKCQLNEAVSRKVNKLRTNTWFFFCEWWLTYQSDVFCQADKVISAVNSVIVFKYSIFRHWHVKITE